METCVIAVEKNQNDVKTQSCFERTYSSMTVDDVYEIAKVVGAEVEKLIDSYGKSSVEGLVAHIVKVLELLESFAARNQAHKCKEEELLKAFETLHLQQQKKRPKECEDSSSRNATESRDWHQKEKKLNENLEVLQTQVLQLKEENQELQARLQCTHSKEDRTQRQEREVMLKLKEVVDKQRDELRAKVQEISSMSKEVEALQEQQERLMKINAELRHKQSIVQTQMKSAVERRADLEADLCEKQKEIERLNAQLERASARPAAAAAETSSSAIDLTDKMIIDLKDPNRPCFTKQEVRDILLDRNELKANLFLVKEELAYYQREILNDERCPGFLLDAVRSAIKKQRTVIKSKMLGIPVSECRIDETDGPLFERSTNEDIDSDSTDSRPQESRIRNLFSFLSLSSLTRTSGSQPSSVPTSSSMWEILDPDEQRDEEETQTISSS